MRPICEISRAVKPIREAQDRRMRREGKRGGGRRRGAGVRWAKVGEPCPTATTWQACDEVTRCMLNHCHASLFCASLLIKACVLVDEYKLQIMPIVTDNRAYVQSYILYVHVEYNKQQMSPFLTVFIGLHPHSPLTPRLQALSYPSHPQINTTGAWIRMDEFAHVCGCNWGGVFAHIWQESPSTQLSSANSSAWRDEMMSRESDRKRGGTKEYQEEKKRCRASTRESVNDCLWVGGETERYAGRRKG